MADLGSGCGTMHGVSGDHNVRFTLWIVRGAPGSGKTALARCLAPAAHYAADDWFYQCAAERGVSYGDVWSEEFLPTAHGWCMDKVVGAMQARVPRVAVHNTFARREHVVPYLEAAEKNGYMPSIIVCCNDYGNEHGVDPNTVIRIRHRIEKEAMTYTRPRR